MKRFKAPKPPLRLTILVWMVMIATFWLVLTRDRRFVAEGRPVTGG